MAIIYRIADERKSGEYSENLFGSTILYISIPVQPIQVNIVQASLVNIV
jgi:hypothetical protein